MQCLPERSKSQIRSPIPIIFAGAWKGAGSKILSVFRSGFDVRLEHQLSPLKVSITPAIFAVEIDSHTSFDELRRLTHLNHLRCFARNRDDDPTLALAAYQAGVEVVLPSSFTGDVLMSTIERFHHALARTRTMPLSTPVQRERTFVRGQIIIPEERAVLDVIDGVISVTVIYSDGAEVLLGLCGSGQTLVGHPEDSCSIRFVTHTDARVRTRSWDDAMRDPNLTDNLRARLQQMEAWAAMQARPHLDQRILGILSLLAEQFGTVTETGMVVDVRITHQQLAAAVGATRTTVTRIVQDLKRTSLLTTVGSGGGERFCLPEWELHRH